MVLTLPLTFGFHDVTLYGAVALKLNALCRLKVVPPCWIDVKLPTAYMVPPHCTSCRTCSVVPVGASAGVPLAGCVDTGPLAATAAAACPAIELHRVIPWRLSSDRGPCRDRTRGLRGRIHESRLNLLCTGN